MTLPPSIPRLVLLGLGLLAPLAARSAAPATIVSPSGKEMRLVFHDEFDPVPDAEGRPGIDRSKWRTSFWQGGHERTLPSNGEAQLYVDRDYAGRDGKLAPADRVHPFSFDRPGVLAIEARPAPEASRKSYGMGEKLRFTSGLLISDPYFVFQYGYVEGRFKLPGNRGAWPAFWLLMNDPRQGATPEAAHHWPPEIDIMEFFGHRPNKFSAAFHLTKPGWRAWKAQGGDWGMKYHELPQPISDDFHTWGMEWDEEKIIFTFDGVEWARATTAEEMKRRMYLLINLAVGGNWYADEMRNLGAPVKPWEVDEASMPWRMLLDYVRVYQTPEQIAASQESAR